MAIKCHLDNKPSNDEERCVQCYYRGPGMICNLGEDENCFAWDPISMFLNAKKWSKQVYKNVTSDNLFIHPTEKRG